LVQHNYVVSEPIAGPFELGDGPHDVLWFHISFQVVLEANEKDAGMSAPRCSNKIVQFPEVVSVRGQYYQAGADSELKVSRV
jgi:hypothetical protein